MLWDELIDWKGHEAWVPSTYVELHGDGDPAAPGAEFTAWTGPIPTSGIGRKLSLQDRMRVAEIDFDPVSGRGACAVHKIGPVLEGTASFSVTPTGGGTRMHWKEDVEVRFLPSFAAPVAAKIGELGFRYSMRRLDKQLVAAGY